MPITSSQSQRPGAAPLLGSMQQNRAQGTAEHVCVCAPDCKHRMVLDINLFLPASGQVVSFQVICPHNLVSDYKALYRARGQWIIRSVEGISGDGLQDVSSLKTPKKRQPARQMQHTHSLTRYCDRKGSGKVCQGISP